MTKAELIKFLEPFSDDIPILYKNEEYLFDQDGLSNINVSYEIASNHCSNLGIGYRDGYIRIK